MPRQDCKNYSLKTPRPTLERKGCDFLAAALVIMLNYIASRHGRRVDLSQARYFALTPATLKCWTGAGPHKNHCFDVAQPRVVPRYTRPAAEYDHFAGDKVQVEFVDPHRDLARSKELALRYDISGPNYLLFETQDRLSGIPLSELADYDYTPILTGGKKHQTFRGEHVVSSAIHGLLQPRKPVVAFLAGHGEKTLKISIPCTVIPRSQD